MAIKYYMKGKQKEHLRCINNLGALYLREHNKIPEAVRGENIEKGMKYLNYAAQLKYPKAYVSLGRCHENGVGVDKNINTAI